MQFRDSLHTNEWYAYKLVPLAFHLKQIGLQTVAFTYTLILLMVLVAQIVKWNCIEFLAT